MRILPPFSSPVFPERDHVVSAAGVVVEGVLGQHQLGVALELPNVHRLPSCLGNAPCHGRGSEVHVDLLFRVQSKLSTCRLVPTGLDELPVSKNSIYRSGSEYAYQSPWEKEILHYCQCVLDKVNVPGIVCYGSGKYAARHHI